MRLIGFILFLGLSWSCSLLSEEGTQPITEEGSAPPLSSFEQDFLQQVNELRASGCRCGDSLAPPVAPLKWHHLLTEAATQHATDLYQNQRFSHTGTDGSSVGTRLTRTGYAWSRVGENIANGYASGSNVLQGWTVSPGHCLNLMDPDFQHTGLAKKGRYWVQTLARPR